MTLDRSLRLLKQSDIESFQENGYLHVKSVVPDEVLNNIQKPINNWVERLIRRWKKAGLISSDFSDLPFDMRLYKAWQAAKQPPYKEYITKELESREVFDFLRNQIFVNIAQDLMNGENILALAGYACRPKLPNKDFPLDTPWHQDAQCAMYTGNNKATFVTMWVPFVDVSEANSCLQVSEATHKNTDVFEDAKNGSVHYSIDPKHYEKFSNLKAISMKRGDVLCLHPLLPHRALPNPSDRMRWSMDIRYEKMSSPIPPTPKRGFVCAHEDASVVETSYEEAFRNIWRLYGHED